MEQTEERTCYNEGDIEEEQLPNKDFRHQIPKEEEAFYGLLHAVSTQRSRRTNSQRSLIFKIAVVPTVLYGSEMYLESDNRRGKVCEVVAKPLRPLHAGMGHSTYATSRLITSKDNGVSQILKQGYAKEDDIDLEAQHGTYESPRKMVQLGLAPKGRAAGRAKIRHTVSADLVCFDSYESYPEKVLDRAS